MAHCKLKEKSIDLNGELRLRWCLAELFALFFYLLFYYYCLMAVHILNNCILNELDK